MSYATVLLDGPTEPLTYRLTPETLAGAIPGALVEVPFGPRTVQAVVLRLERTVPTAIKEKLRPIKKLLSNGVWAPPATIRLAQAMAAYAGEPAGLCLFRILPPASKRTNHHVRPAAVRLPSKTLHIYGPRTQRIEQYRTLITKAIASKRQVILVAPVNQHEWLAERLTTLTKKIPLSPPSQRGKSSLLSQRRVGEDLSVRIRTVTAELAPGEQRKIAEDLATGLIDVLITTRHAIGWPAYALGAVIVDDPHHLAHVDEQRPYIDSATIALLRSSAEGGYAVLGTSLATPTLSLREQMGLATRLSSSRHPELASGSVQIENQIPKQVRNDDSFVDTAHSLRLLTAAGQQLILPEVIHVLDEALEQDTHAAIIAPRHGVGGQLRCTDCARTVICSVCSEEMSVRSDGNTSEVNSLVSSEVTGAVRATDLFCNSCGATTPIPLRCPSCNGTKLRASGIGVDSIRAWLTKQAPELLAKGLIVDSEGLHEKSGEYGAIAFVFADSPLSSPDLLRPIRYLGSIIEAQGCSDQVVIQTYNPQQAWLRVLSDPIALAEVLAERKADNLPPYVRTLHLSGPIGSGADVLEKLSVYDLGRSQRQGDQLLIDLHYTSPDRANTLAVVRQLLGRGWHSKVDSVLEQASGERGIIRKNS